MLSAEDKLEGRDIAAMSPGMPSPSQMASPSTARSPPWLETYPELMAQMQGVFEEWREEREQLLRNAEQTQAYCQSLAFQVKSLQEENGRLQKEMARQLQDEEVEQAEALSRLKSECAVLKSAHEALQQEHARTLSEKTRLERENSDLVNALAVEAQGSSTDKVNPSPGRSQGESLVSDDESGLDVMFDQSLAAEMRLVVSPPMPSQLVDVGVVGASRSEELKPVAEVWCQGEVWRSESYPQPVHGIAISRAQGSLGDVGVVSWDGTCSLLRAQDAQAQGPAYQPVWSVSPGKGLYSVAFGTVSRGGTGGGPGSVLGVCSMDQRCYVLDGRNGAVLYTFSGHEDEVNSLHFQPSAAGGAETLVASVSDDTLCLVWAPAAGKSDCLARLEGHSQAVYGVRFHPIHPSLLATVGFDHVGKIWDLRTGQAELEVVGHTDDVIGVDFSPNGMLLATGSDDYTCRIWDLRKLGSNGNAADAHAAGAGRNHLFCLQHQDDVKRLEWSPCGAQLATASANGSASVWQMPSFKPSHDVRRSRTLDDGAAPTLARSLQGHADTVFDVAWVPRHSAAYEQGARLLSASHDNTVRAWGTAKALKVPAGDI